MKQATILKNSRLFLCWATYYTFGLAARRFSEAASVIPGIAVRYSVICIWHASEFLFQTVYPTLIDQK